MLQAARRVQSEHDGTPNSTLNLESFRPKRQHHPTRRGWLGDAMLGANPHAEREFMTARTAVALIRDNRITELFRLEGTLGGL